MEKEGLSRFGEKEFVSRHITLNTYVLGREFGIFVKSQVPKILGLTVILIFALSAANTIHAIGVTTTITAGSNPVGVAYDPATREVFVANYQSDDVQIFSDTTNSVVADITGPSGVYDLAYDSGKGEMWVTGGAVAYAISDATKKIVGNVTDVLPNLTRIAYDSGKGEIFVSPSAYDTPTPDVVQVISDSTNKVVDNITTQTPFAMVYDSAKGEIFLSQSNGQAGGANVAVISDSTNSVITTIPVTATGFLAYDPAKGEIFAQSGSTVSVISDSSNKVVATVSGVNFGWEGTLAYDSGKGVIYMNGENEVEVISDSTNKVIGTWSTGFTQPTDIAYDPGTGAVYAANSLIPGTVAVISDSSSGTSVSSTSPTSSAPTTASTTPTTSNVATTTPSTSSQASSTSLSASYLLLVAVTVGVMLPLALVALRKTKIRA